MAKLFVSYAGPDTDLMENLRARLADHGVHAWVFSADRMLAKEMWDDISEQLRSADCFAFAISDDSANAAGQQKELEIVVEMMKQAGGDQRILPIVLGDTPYDALPEKLRWINGLQMDAWNVGVTAQEIVERFFPELTRDQNQRPWITPRPGQWLRVGRLIHRIEQHLEVDDLLCFHAVSPIGLFECYSRKLNSLFWIHPDAVVDARLSAEAVAELNREVPYEFSTQGRIEIEGRGWHAWHSRSRSG